MLPTLLLAISYQKRPLLCETVLNRLLLASCKCCLNTKIVLLMEKSYNSIISSKLDSKTFVATALFLLTSFIFLDLQSSFALFHLVFFPSCLVWQNVLLSLLKFHFTKKVYLPFCSFLQKLGIVQLQSSNFFKCWSVELALDSKCILSWWMATRHELSLDEFNYELWQKLASVICVNGPHFLLWVMGYLFFEAFLS